MKIINTTEIIEKNERKISSIIRIAKAAKLGEPKLVIIQVEGDKASDSYVKNKIAKGEKVGVKVSHIKFPNDVSQKLVIDYVNRCNEDKDVHGIIVQLPLPEHLNEREILDSISFLKDVDGLGTIQSGMLINKSSNVLIPCTAMGVSNILQEITDLKGKDIVIVNRSHLIGIPLRTMLTECNSTVTVCHSKTKDLKSKMRNADIVITGIGKAEYFDETYFKDGQIIIDCSMNFKDGKLCGDVNVKSLENLDVQIASGKGHTGPMTVLSLMANTLLSFSKSLL